MKHMKKNNFNLWQMVILILLLFILSFIIIYQYKLSKPSTAIVENNPTPTDKNSIEEPTEEHTIEESEGIIYPKPEYTFTTEIVTIEIPNLTKEYTLAWVSDLHLIADHESGDVSEEFLPTVEDRYNNMFVTADGKHTDELWPEIVKFLNIGDYDGIILGGDLMDYCSTKNMSAFIEGYSQLYAPIIYIRADHDYGSWYGNENFTQEHVYELHKSIDGDDLHDKYLDFGEFLIVGINNSTKNITVEQLEILKKLYDTNKPIIAVTHVPYRSYVDDSLETLSMEFRNKIYYWGGGEYIPNEETNKYIDYIYRDDSNVKQVLAGHLHTSWDGMITDQVRQHIFTPAYSGTIGLIHIVPAK